MAIKQSRDCVMAIFFMDSIVLEKPYFQLFIALLDT